LHIACIFTGIIMKLIQSKLRTTSINLPSSYLNRQVKIDCYLPFGITPGEPVQLLLINDGQNLPAMHFQIILEKMLPSIQSLFVVGITAGEERKQEYGTAGIPNFRGEGSKATEYTHFILEELLPFLKTQFHSQPIGEKAFAGFSLGGLSALDIVWQHPEIFNRAGVFSGSLWWRTKALDKGYEEDKDRIMHQKIREGEYKKGLKFFFECGTADEKNDRNHNGKIDSVEDTEDLINELAKKGYSLSGDIHYLLIEGGKHNEVTWAKALPEFLLWGWGRNQ
jgi:iron(III)-enterobactin esterase